MEGTWADQSDLMDNTSSTWHHYQSGEDLDMKIYEDDYTIPKSLGHKLSRTWSQKHGARFHPGLAAPDHMDDQRAEFLPQESPQYDVVHRHIDQFNEALRIYASSPKAKGLQDLDLQNAHSWDDVFREYERAQLKYEEKAKGWLGFPRRIGRAMGNNAKSINPFLDFIPGGEYTSTVKTALFLIFGAASRLSERRKQILEAFGKIPFLIQDAEFSIEDFAEDETLREATVALYLAILQTSFVMMEWLVEKRYWEPFKGFFQGAEYNRKILPKMIENLHTQSGIIQHRIDRLTRGAIVKTATTTVKMASTLETVKSTTNKTGLDIGETKMGLKKIEAATFESSSELKEIRRQQDQINNVLAEILQYQIKNAAWIDLTSLAQSLSKRAQSPMPEPGTKPTVDETEPQHPQIQQGMPVLWTRLLELLAISTNIIAQDLEAALRQGHIGDHATQGRAQLLMQSPKFETWLSSAQSQALLVDGQAEYSLDKLSAMSTVCALLAQTLPSDTASIITFFCGLHMDEFAATGPKDLIRSLLSQLIRRHKLDTSFVEGTAYEELLRLDFRRLCALMTEMVRKLPSGTVLFCLVDGISWYETEEMRQDSCAIVQMLTELARDSDVRAVFKLLLTSPMASRYVRDCVPQQDRLSLSSDAAEHDGSPFQERFLAVRREEFDNSWQEEFDEGYAEEYS